jgi:lysophospholipase L1-like esterase
MSHQPLPGGWRRFVALAFASLVLPAPAEANPRARLHNVRSPLHPGGTSARGAAKPRIGPNSITAAPRSDAYYTQLHQSFLQRAQQGNIDLLFLGDSITDWWRTTGAPVWKKNYEPLRAANFGIAGDTTESLLWRIREGKELQGFKAKVIVLLIGTNNLIWGPADQIPIGTAVIVQTIRKEQPQAHVLVLGVFPRGASRNDPFRSVIRGMNPVTHRLVAGPNVTFLDIGAAFVDPAGNTPVSVMADGLHPTLRGYGLWAKAMRPTLMRLLGLARKAEKLRGRPLQGRWGRQIPAIQLTPVRRR